MRAHATPIACADKKAVDIVGTGGDGAHTFIFPPPLLLSSPAQGSLLPNMDRMVLLPLRQRECTEALGINLHYSPEKMEEALNTLGIAFLLHRHSTRR